MHRQKKKVGKLCLLFALLVMAVLFLVVVPQTSAECTGQGTAVGQEPEAEHNAAAENEGLLAEKTAGAELALLSVAKEDGGFTDYSIERREENYVILDFPKDKLDKDRLVQVMETFLQARVTEDLGEQADLEQFGLTEERTDLTIVWQEGEEQALQIGCLLPGRPDACYALKDGAVCIVEGFPMELLEGRRAFYDLELVAIAPARDEQGETVDELKYLYLEGRHFEEPVRIVRSDRTNSGYLMEAPAYGEAMFAATDTVTQEVSVVDSLAYVEASAVVCENADMRAAEQYGLAKPYAAAEYTLNGESHKLRVSSLQDGVRYLMLDEDPNIYQVEDIRVRAWAEADPARLRTSYIWLVDVGQLAGLTVTDEAGSREYRVEQGSDGEEQDFSVYCADRELDAEGEWLPFYQKLLGMAILHTKKPDTWEEKPAYVIVYRYVEAAKDAVTVELFREAGGGRYVAFLDGSFAGVLRADTVERTMELADWMSVDEEER